MSYNVGPRFTFRGLIPPGSDKEHIGIVLNEKESTVLYCYCTSKGEKIINNDFVNIPKEKMLQYFNDPKETFIFISERHIFSLPSFTLKSRLDNEYDVLEPIDDDTYEVIIDKIKNSNNLSARFKKELLEFLK
jgi:hypothetical protein